VVQGLWVMGMGIYKESITIRIFKLHHGDTESTELFYIFSNRETTIG